MKATSDDALLKIDEMPEFLTVDEPCLSDEDPEAWHVQVNRFIATSK